MERQLSGQHDPLDLAATLPRDRINILLISPTLRSRCRLSPCRAVAGSDCPGQSARERRDVAPPTFDQLRTHLHARPGYYHIVHFDGHGGYGPGTSSDGFRLKGAQGRLLFETETGAAEPVSADQISARLREYRIPMVLNACQSAMIDAAQPQTPLPRLPPPCSAGVRSVVAMAYASTGERYGVFA